MGLERDTGGQWALEADSTWETHSVGFLAQGGLPHTVCKHLANTDGGDVHRSESVSHSVMSDSLWPHGLCSLPGSSVYGILQARIRVWTDIPRPGIFGAGVWLSWRMWQDSIYPGRTRWWSWLMVPPKAGHDMHTKIKEGSTQVPGHPVPPEDKQNPSPSPIPARAHSCKRVIV